jgi:glycosyltransferase involved in cell wall biosynthesis
LRIVRDESRPTNARPVLGSGMTAGSTAWSGTPYNPRVLGATEPLVTAVIPAYNAAKCLGEAVESVLAQTHPQVECVVVDDGSTDGTLDVACSFGSRVRVLRQSNRGVAAARNAGAASGSGGALAFLDADDIWEPTLVESQLALLHAHGAEAALCASRAFEGSGEMLELIRLRPLPPTPEGLLLWQGPVVSPGSNLLVDREAFGDLGGFEETLSTAADWHLLVRLVMRGRVAYSDQPLVRKRWHRDNMSADVDATEADLRRAYTMILREHAWRLRVSEREAWAGLHRMLAVANFRRGRRALALRHGAEAACRDPIRIPGGLVRMARRQGRDARQSVNA